ncbi:hypothetical protein PsYK624_124900 [Phanerochaete sordida]|uniref:F-box domain-containing protein n=1 Tax=Phanerochaete sordida TaxID=48140 RepID=A0A9P3LI90_9APHY|nr:hypothetical protein PsYK624_124900 [Phanerochaete sordida]
MLAAERRARLAALQKEYGALYSQIDELQAQISQVQSLVEQKKREMAPLAPVYTLPEDVVAEILKFAYLHHFPYCRLDDGLPHTNSPVAISHVSRWWRRQAISLPSIWSCIHVTPEQPSHYAEVLKTYLIRSRSLPLSISFLCFARDDSATAGYIVPQLEWSSFATSTWRRFKASWRYLMAEKYRWKNAHITLWHDESAATILRSLTGKFPQLQFLGISLGCDDGSLPSITTIDPREVIAPLLTHVRLDRLSQRIKKPSRSLFGHLTELNLNGLSCTIRELMAVLAMTKDTLKYFALVEAYITVTPGGATAFTSSTLPNLTLPKLKYLLLDEINDQHDQHDQATFTIICRAAVALETLISSNTTILDDISQGRVTLPTVRHLVVSYGWGAEEADIMAIILATPSLETLQTQAIQNISTWLDLAVDMHTAGHGIAWPNLRSLTMTMVVPTSLRAFVQHRTQIKKPLKDLVLPDHLVDSLSQADQAAFRELKLNLVKLSEAPPEIRAHNDWADTWWDEEVDKPRFEPWNGSLAFEDQWGPPKVASDVESDESDESDDEVSE